MSSVAASAEEIQREMKHVRTELRENVRELVESAREITAWQRYVQAYPWVCLGAAAFAGYLIVPARSHIASADADRISELVESRLEPRLATPPKRQGSVVTHALSSVVGMALSGLLQVGLSLASQQLNQYVAKSLAAHASQPHPNGEPRHDA